MKKLFVFVLALSLCIHASAAPLLNILQVECVRKGTAAYKPRSSLPFTDLTIQSTQDVFPNISDHATLVAQYWQGGGTASLVKTWYVCESVNFELSILKAGKTLPPLPAQWHLAIMPYGQSCTWTDNSTYGSDRKLAQQAERDNVLVLVSPPDAGQGFYGSPCLAVSPNIIHVASSTTGSDMAGMPANELYIPQDWNSYAEPVAVETGIAQILDWLLQNGIAYKASDIKMIILATATKDSQGRAIFNGGSALAAVKAKYSSPLPAPLPPDPVVEPVVTPTPSPTPTPAPTSGVITLPGDSVTPLPPTMVPVTTTTDNGAPQINSWGSWNSAWSSPTTPTTFYWSATHCTSVTITDPNGKQIQEPPTGRLIVTKPCPNAGWTVSASNAGYTVTSKTEFVHGCL